MIYSIIHVFSWKLVYLTTVESYSHFCTLINLIIIICSIQYIQTNGRLRRLKKSSEGETKTLGNFDSSYCTLLLETSPLIHSVNTSLMRKEKVYIYIFNMYFQIKTLLKTTVYIFIFILRRFKNGCVYIYIYMYELQKASVLVSSSYLSVSRLPQPPCRKFMVQCLVRNWESNTLYALLWLM